ncbi:MAG TPA: YdeI/OmpD-associated family protein [Paenarthrobacter sp.]|nr:YdeI/OmpD-associated family protein [Paenarthrobacter sp.]
MPIELAELIVKNADQWREWLSKHAAESRGVWLVLHKKGGNVTELDYDAALDEALCFGWIDGQVKKRDAESYFQRMTPRGAKSIWSARNVGHIARLDEAGKMTAAGWAAVDAAKADGRWEAAYAGPATIEVPADLAAAIAAVPEAQAMFDVLTSQNRFALIHRTNTVKRAETGARKIEGFVEMLARHEAPYPQKKRPASAPN